MVEKIKKEIKPHVVKGRVILKLKEEPARAVTTSVPTGRKSTVAKLGIASVDEILSDYKTLGLTKLRGAPTESLPGGIRVRRVSEPETSHETSGFSRTYIVKVPPETDLSSMIKKLKENPNVENAHVDYFARMATVPNDRYYREQWGLRQIKCEEAWELEKGSPEVIIALVDTGVDQSHPDLLDKLVPGYDMVDLTDVEPEEGCVWEGDFSTRDTNAEDENGHGTHCAGIAAASTNNDRGVAGVAWNCKIMPVRVLANIRCTTPEGTYVDGSGTFTDIADGVIWAADHGAHVISMSLGGLVPLDGPQPELLRDALDYAHSRGCVIVAAMGNDGVNPERYGYYAYPAAHPKVLAVGAVDQHDRRADFSNYGHYKQVMAPGVEIRSTYIGSDYADLNGTSMATPFVSGLAALIKSAAPDLSPDEIMATIRQTAASGGNYTEEYGYGLVDAFKAVLAVGPKPCQPTQFIQREISPGAEIPDNNKKGIESVITVSESGKICDIKVIIDISHTWISDLVVALVSPSGEEVKLHDRTGASTKDIVKTYDRSIAPGLRSFEKMDVKGAWKLKVADHARRDVGTLNRWGLELGIDGENGGEAGTMEKKALCVGINDYPFEGNDLNGCVNDAKAWADLLVEHYGFARDNVRLMLDGEATKANIMTYLEDLVTGAKSGDLLVFVNSSHGTYVADTSGDEEKYDEALCPYDCADNLIIDDELRELFAELADGVNLTVISDSCFSGTVTRAAPAIKTADDRRVKFLNPALIGRKVLINPWKAKSKGKTKHPESEMKEVLLSGCTDQEYSYDALIGGVYHGAMSYCALKAIQEANFQITFQQLHTTVLQLLEEEQYNQHPQLEGKEANKQKSVFT